MQQVFSARLHLNLSTAVIADLQSSALHVCSQCFARIELLLHCFSNLWMQVLITLPVPHIRTSTMNQHSSAICADSTVRPTCDPTISNLRPHLGCCLGLCDACLDLSAGREQQWISKGQTTGELVQAGKLVVQGTHTSTADMAGTWPSSCMVAGS